jgi:hypothetical protein
VPGGVEVEPGGVGGGAGADVVVEVGDLALGEEVVEFGGEGGVGREAGFEVGEHGDDVGFVAGAAEEVAEEEVFAGAGAATVGEDVGGVALADGAVGEVADGVVDGDEGRVRRRGDLV